MNETINAFIAISCLHLTSKIAKKNSDIAK